MRPRSLEEFFGHGEVLAEHAMLRDALEQGELPSLILWGPPGVGKTTLARLLAERVEADLIALSAVLARLSDVREALAKARQSGGLFGRTTLLFIDEIHRFNKAQQDVLLPHVERGDVTLLGATTENPYFEVNAALRSRLQIVRLEAHDEATLGRIARSALEDRERGLGEFEIGMSPQAERALARYAGGDARAALNALEIAARRAWARARREAPLGASPETRPGAACCIEPQDLSEALSSPRLVYDRGGGDSAHLISAFIKSMRGSHPDAALYYMWRIIEGGEDPTFVLRRMLIFASEDIGLADSRALTLVASAMTTARQVGMPEAGYALTHAAIYLSLAPKSHSVTAAMKAARELARSRGQLAVPQSLQKPAPPGLYRSPHDAPTGYLPEERYLPEAISQERLYRPGRRGEEPELGRWRRNPPGE